MEKIIAKYINRCFSEMTVAVIVSKWPGMFYNRSHSDQNRHVLTSGQSQDGKHVFIQSAHPCAQCSCPLVT